MTYYDFDFETARKWYYGNNEELRALAIEKYGKYDLMNESDKQAVQMECSFEMAEQYQERYENEKDYEATCASYDF